MLRVNDRSTTWDIQYGVGVAPTSFTTLGTYSDSGVFGSTTQTFNPSDFGSNLDNQLDVVFRVVTLSATSGSGSRDTFAIDNFSITAIPEPSSALMLLSSVFLLSAFRRR